MARHLDQERLAQLKEAAELAAIIEDKNAKWIDAEAFGLQLAGSRIAEARQKIGLTQTQLAARLKIPQSQISRIERNPDRTTVRTLKKMAKALGVDVGVLLGR